MIQFNLLPDVKLEYIKAQRTKHFVMTVSVLSSVASLVLLITLVLTVNVWQSKTIKDLSGDIKTTSSELKSTKDLNKILTVQSQLGSLDTLHGQKPAGQRLFGYLSQVTPLKATISDVTADFTANTLSITGKAPSLDVVNTFTDALKFTSYGQGEAKGSWAEGTTYKADEIVSNGRAVYVATTEHAASSATEPGVGSEWQNDWKLAPSAFSGVVLSSFGRTEDGATYTITLNFDAAIFSNINETSLVVPNIITTRSIVEQPLVLFDGSTKEQVQ
ncbi:hypothetical protein BH09PAT4_BH09PAT4_08220 [soil metagenome]